MKTYRIYYRTDLPFHRFPSEVEEKYKKHLFQSAMYFEKNSSAEEGFLHDVANITLYHDEFISVPNSEIDSWPYYYLYPKRFERLPENEVEMQGTGCPGGRIAATHSWQQSERICYKKPLINNEIGCISLTNKYLIVSAKLKILLERCSGVEFIPCIKKDDLPQKYIDINQQLPDYYIPNYFQIKFESKSTKKLDNLLIIKSCDRCNSILLGIGIDSGHHLNSDLSGDFILESFVEAPTGDKFSLINPNIIVSKAALKTIRGYSNDSGNPYGKKFGLIGVSLNF